MNIQGDEIPEQAGKVLPRSHFAACCGKIEIFPEKNHDSESSSQVNIPVLEKN